MRLNVWLSYGYCIRSFSYVGQAGKLTKIFDCRIVTGPIIQSSRRNRVESNAISLRASGDRRVVQLYRCFLLLERTRKEQKTPARNLLESLRQVNCGVDCACKGSSIVQSHFGLL